MSLIVFLNEVVFASLEGIIYLLFFIVLINRRDFIKKNRIKSLIYIVLFSILSYWFTTYLPVGIHTIAHLAFIVLLISAITRTNIYVSAITNIISSIFIVVTELLVSLVLLVILDISMQTLLENPSYKLIALIFSRGILLTILRLVLDKGKLSINIGIFKKENVSNALPLFVVLIIMIFFVTYTAFTDSKSDMVIFSVMFLTSITLLSILYLLEFKERENMFQIKSRLESQQLYVENMESVIDIIRREKHDFANHLNTIAGICRLGSEDALNKVDEYLQNIIGVYQPTYAFYASGSDFVNGLLAVKSNFAFQNNIYMDVDFDAPLSEANVNDQDMVSIVSNIIDNAFEAMCSDGHNNKKVLSVLSYLEQDNLCIAISNNGPRIPDNSILKIFTQKYSTKTSKDGRGYGLFIVKQIISKNGGEIEVMSDEECTEFLIKLKKKTNLT